jgi:hypothetical protein
VFELRKVAPLRARAPWLASALLHAVVIAIALTVAWRVGPRVTFIKLSPPVARPLPPMAPYGTRRGHAPSGVGGPLTTARPEHAPPPAAGRGDTALDLAAGPGLIATPRGGDGRIWVSPRPALPAEVAYELYVPHLRRDSVSRDSIVTRRLRAMVDSMNKIIDIEQREHRLPSWTTGGESGPKFGLDSSHIYIAGLKVPTAVLMALGSMLPQGNYDEAMRSRALAQMREDMLQAARRTETLREFRQYVREIRARKQAEHDAERRQRGDTVVDTVRAVP